MAREIVFDTETTGLKPFVDDRITEIGCVEVIDFIPTGKTWRQYVNPERAVPEEVVKITGLTTDFLSDKPVFDEIVDAFMEFVGESTLVAHNARFDRDFINVELAGVGRPPLPEKRFIDTLSIARKRFPGAYNSLDALCKRFDISLSERTTHGALLDAKLLAEVYLALNGGRERRLDLVGPEKTGVKDPDSKKIDMTKTAARALAMKLSQKEREDHKAFIKTLGKEALWTRF